MRRLSSRASRTPDTWSRQSAARTRLRWRRQAGAHTVVNYREPDVVDKIREAAPDGIDRFVEVALHENIELDLAVAAPHALITSYAADDASVAQVPVRQLMGPNLTLRFMLLYTIPRGRAAGRDRAHLRGARRRCADHPADSPLHARSDRGAHMTRSSRAPSARSSSTFSDVAAASLRPRRPSPGRTRRLARAGTRAGC